MYLKKLILHLALTLSALWSTKYCNAQIRTLNGKNLTGREIDSFILRQMDSLKIPGISFAIVQDEKLVYYLGAGIRNDRGDTVDSSTVFEAASMTKPVFAYVVHKLVQKGNLHLDTPLHRYFPYEITCDERYKLLTTRMVLSHSTGFPNWRRTDTSELTFGFEPGTQYGYSGEGFVYLGLAVQHLLKKDIADLVNDEIFRPLAINSSFLTKNQYVQAHLADGLKDNKEWGRNYTWQKPNVAFSLCTEAREYVKFVIQLMKESKSSQSTFHQMSLPQMEIEQGRWVCLGLFVEQTQYGPKYSHSGNNNNRYNSNFEFYKDHGIAYVFFMNCHKEPAFTKRFNEFITNGK